MKHSLEEIADWLESDNPPTPAQARILYEDLIPATLELEVATLHDKSNRLLEEAKILAGILPDRREEESKVPDSCSRCNSAEVSYSYGEYFLYCTYLQSKDDTEDLTHRRLLDKISPDIAFRQPASYSADQLLADRIPPEWCPKREQHAKP